MTTDDLYRVLRDALAEALRDEAKSGRWDGYEVDRLHFVCETFAALLLAHPSVRAALSAHDAVPGLDVEAAMRHMRYNLELRGKQGEFVEGWDAATRACFVLLGGTSR